MRVAITGASGFLGWHARCALKARGVPFVAVNRADFGTPDRLTEALRGADVILHLGGANRAEPTVLREDNLRLAREVTAALDQVGTHPTIVYANSVQSGNGTAFGDGKSAAADYLSEWGASSGAAVADVRLPNLFGEHGRPNYNSVVATFCHELATGGTPVVHEDREIPLLHVQDAVDAMLDAAATEHGGVVKPAGRPTSVSDLLQLLTGFRDLYAIGDIPNIINPLHLSLFNTYRSFCFPQLFPIHPPLRADNRGHLFECSKAHGGQSQVFCSTSHPGVTRGEHFHLRKIERFMVLRGTARIALRRLFDEAVISFDVSGERPAIVDMPTMWAHSITNTGEDELMTLFWASEILDPSNPDTFAEPVGTVD